MERQSPTMRVPAAGKKYYGLGRNASYAAAKRGEIPTIQIGGRIFAIGPLIERRLGLLGDHQEIGPAGDSARKSPHAHANKDMPEKT